MQAPVFPVKRRMAGQQAPRTGLKKVLSREGEAAQFYMPVAVTMVRSAMFAAMSHQPARQRHVFHHAASDITTIVVWYLQNVSVRAPLLFSHAAVKGTLCLMFLIINTCVLYYADRCCSASWQAAPLHGTRFHNTYINAAQFTPYVFVTHSRFITAIAIILGGCVRCIHVNGPSSH